jgi:hypothetical protein
MCLFTRPDLKLKQATEDIRVYKIVQHIDTLKRDCEIYESDYREMKNKGIRFASPYTVHPVEFNKVLETELNNPELDEEERNVTLWAEEDQTDDNCTIIGKGVFHCFKNLDYAEEHAKENLDFTDTFIVVCKIPKGAWYVEGFDDMPKRVAYPDDKITTQIAATAIVYEEIVSTRFNHKWDRVDLVLERIEGEASNEYLSESR